MPTRESWSATVQRDAKSLVQALYSGDLATVVDYAHPTIVRGLGGRERALATVEKSMSTILKRGIQVESFTFPRPPDFVETDRAVFAIVPTLMVVGLDSQRIESLNYQFGILDVDAEAWRYVEASRINTSNVRSLFPSLPDGYDFPNIYRKRL